MTVKYTHRIPEATVFGYLKLLLKWEGSLWKLVWKDLLAYLVIYYIIYFSYLWAFNDGQKKIFQIVAKYCNKISYHIPLNFLIGFYVKRVLGRFWQILSKFPFPSQIAFYAGILIVGQDDETRKMKRSFIRYVSSSYITLMRNICAPVNKRFPTVDHLKQAGMLSDEEAKMLQSSFYGKYLGVLWAQNLVNKAVDSGRIKSSFDSAELIKHVNNYRKGCAQMFKYDITNLPLMYIQVVNLATYIFCFSTLLGRYPFIESGTKEMHFPFFSLCQFLIYISWLRVGQSLANPLGFDDDDFDINQMLDSSINEAVIIVDRVRINIPTLNKDQHFGKANFNIPGSPVDQTQGVYIGSAAGYNVDKALQSLVEVDKVAEADS